VNEIEHIQQAKRGDAAAWGNLVRQHQEAIFRLAYLLLHDVDDAEDVTQETFIRAYRNLHRFDSTRPLRPWLLEIARNQCHNWSRAMRRHLAALQRWRDAAPNSGSAIADVAAGADSAMLQQWQANTLWQAVRRLNETDQEVVYLRCFLELSVEETAQVLKVAPGTVKSRLWRALERLRRIVEKDFPALRKEATL
jgi:RNA polymerase sigma-70 factor (ECF subfamily)